MAAKDNIVEDLGRAIDGIELYRSRQGSRQAPSSSHRSVSVEPTYTSQFRMNSVMQQQKEETVSDSTTNRL